MDTKINLESLLPPTGLPVTVTPVQGNGSFAQTFLQQLKGTPDVPGGDASAETPKLPGLDSLIDSLVTKLAGTSYAGQSAKSNKLTSALNTDPNAPSPNASTPDTSAVNPLIAALLNGVPPAQLPPIVQNAAASAGDNQSAPQLGIGLTGDSANTARALQQVMTTIVQQTGANDMTKNQKPGTSLKGLPVATPPDMTPKPITPAIDPSPKPVTAAEVQATSFIPPAGPDGVMTPATPRPPESKPMTSSAAVSSLSGKINGLPSAGQNTNQAAVQPAVQNPAVQNPAVQSSDQKNHSETSSQSGAGQNSSDSDSKKKSPDAQQFSAPAATPSNSMHAQTGNISIPSQPAGQNSPNQHAATPSAPAAPNVLAANDTAAPRVVHEARLMQAAGQAEMQVSMRSESAGTVSVKAILEGSHLSATVSAPSVETRDWLVNNLHELHAGLSRDDLNLRSFQVADSSLQGGWNGPDARQQESQEQYRSSGYSGGFPETRGEPITETDLDSLDLNETASQALSLHA